MFAHKKNDKCAGYVDDPLPNIVYFANGRKKDTKLIHGGIGRTWERNFYMGTQNGSKSEI